MVAVLRRMPWQMRMRSERRFFWSAAFFHSSQSQSCVSSRPWNVMLRACFWSLSGISRPLRGRSAVVLDGHQRVPVPRG